MINTLKHVDVTVLSTHTCRPLSVHIHAIFHGGGGGRGHTSHFHPLGKEALPPCYHKKAYFLTQVVAPTTPKVFSMTKI